MVTKRKPRQAFVTEPLSNSKASICQNCYENNIDSKLVVYSKDPEHEKVCPYCGTIYNNRMLRFESLPQPLGHVGGIGKASFTVVSPLRSMSRKNKDSDDVFDVNDYKLPNGEVDKDLVHYASQGFIVSVNDSGNDGDDTE